MLLFFKYVTINRTAFGSEALFEFKKSDLCQTNLAEIHYLNFKCSPV